MHRYCSEAIQVGRKLCQQAFRKLTKHDEEISDSDERAAINQSAERIPESVDDDSSSSAARLSRRSSLLVKILSHVLYIKII